MMDVLYFSSFNVWIASHQLAANQAVFATLHLRTFVLPLRRWRIFLFFYFTMFAFFVNTERKSSITAVIVIIALLWIVLRLIDLFRI